MNSNINSNSLKSPFTGGEVVFFSEQRKAVFRKEEFEYIHLAYQCVDTKEIFTTTQLDVVNTTQIYNQYRAEHNIPFPDEIRELRTRYGLSASKISRILGFGENQYRLYENGEMPSIANGRVLRAIQFPDTFKTFVEEADGELEKSEMKRVKEQIRFCKEREQNETTIRQLIFGSLFRNQFNGYALQSLSNLKNILLFFIEKFNGVFVTQMNKLLFYTDFLAYREYGQAISGLSFRAIQFGPVPLRWDRVYSLVDDVEQILVESKNGNIGSKLISRISPDLSAFSEEQIEILNKVYLSFRNDTPASISEKSHDEIAWIKNAKEHSLIDFKYAFSLRI